MKESMLCTKTHEYLLEENDKYEVGITSYAIEVILQMVKEPNRPNKITVYAEK